MVQIKPISQGGWKKGILTVSCEVMSDLHIRGCWPRSVKRHHGSPLNSQQICRTMEREGRSRGKTETIQIRLGRKSLESVRLAVSNQQQTDEALGK